MGAYEIVERPEVDQLGETPFWDVWSRTLFWCDIVGKEVRRYDPSTGRIDRRPTPSFCSGVVPTTDNHLLIMLVDGVYHMKMDGTGVAPFARPDSDPRNRCNEVRTDAQGRLWLGTMGNNIGPGGEDVEQPQGARGSVYCIDGRGFARRVLDDIGITNTFCWSPDGQRFYTADTAKRVIWSFAYEAGPARVHDRKVLAEGDVAPGNPDGATIDEEGCLWSARWGAGRIVRFTPKGKVDRTIELPATQPSSCMFGGADFKTLYVTSARQGLDQPGEQDGALFAIPMEVGGLPMPRFALS